MNSFYPGPKEGFSPGGDGGSDGPGRSPGQTPFQVDDSKASTSYANFCRITGTPEEVFIDFGINLQPFAPPAGPIVITQRIVMNYYTAKRLLQVLHLTIQRHEATFGVLETDVQKRMRGGPSSGGQP
ncbi:MAG: DUF3467 domain-containing protein [Thermoguttaceae bacterium]|nr:DUF3467 domain-containing protein [Thermoguttaceae bacterium]MDW8037219.1 DUF3467 domain-containing protein [Thermoguttaceae bacterium]